MDPTSLVRLSGSRWVYRTADGLDTGWRVPLQIIPQIGSAADESLGG